MNFVESGLGIGLGLLLAACGSTVTGGDAAAVGDASIVNDAAVADAIPAGDAGHVAFDTTPGHSVDNGAITAVVVASPGGGFLPPPPDGAPCVEYSYSYTVRRDTGLFEWSDCRVTGTHSMASDYTPEHGQRALTAAETSNFDIIFEGTQVSGANNCGADQPTVTLEVRAADASMVYGDDFYACNHQFTAYVRTADIDRLSMYLAGLPH